MRFALRTNGLYGVNETPKMYVPLYSVQQMYSCMDDERSHKPVEYKGTKTKWFLRFWPTRHWTHDCSRVPDVFWIRVAIASTRIRRCGSRRTIKITRSMKRDENVWCLKPNIVIGYVRRKTVRTNFFFFLFCYSIKTAVGASVNDNNKRLYGEISR